MMNTKQEKGFSLVELMIAMVVGLVIISGAFSLHSTTRKIQVANETQLDMVADARFAIEMIAYDLRHAGMWGGTNKESFIRCRSSETTPCTASDANETLPAEVTVIGDCDAGWAYDLTTPIFGTDDSEGANPYSGSCLPSSVGLVASEDILEIRYADSNPPTALLNKQMYIRSNAINGKIFVGATQPVIDAYDASPLTKNHELHAYIYYISDYSDAADDGIPSLRRVSLVNGPEMQNQMLISGVEKMQVQFGEANDKGGDVTRYVNANDVTDWTKVHAAKIWLLMRSDRNQIGADTKKTFSIAGIEAEYGGKDEPRYFLVTSVVNLRNTKQI